MSLNLFVFSLLNHFKCSFTGSFFFLFNKNFLLSLVVEKLQSFVNLLPESIRRVTCNSMTDRFSFCCFTWITGGDESNMNCIHTVLSGVGVEVLLLHISVDVLNLPQENLKFLVIFVNWHELWFVVSTFGGHTFFANCFFFIEPKDIPFFKITRSLMEWNGILAILEIHFDSIIKVISAIFGLEGFVLVEVLRSGLH